MVGIPQDERLNLSNGWLGRYKERKGLKELKRHGEAASANAETVKNERERIQELIKRHCFELRDIFNMDETGLFYAYIPNLSLSFTFDRQIRMAPDRGLTDCEQSGIKGNINRLTYAFMSNADGSEKLPPIIIGKPAMPRAFN